MNFNKHFELEGKHAFLSPSQYHWINYDEDKLLSSYMNYKAKERGTRLHAFAKECIELGIKLPKSNKTLNMYVNDAIGYKMTPEQPLYFSENCFGTADAISFKSNLLRIHDLKSGSTPASMNQLLVYSALFCLEYEYDPNDISFELRIYQADEVLVHTPEVEEILPIISKIVEFDKVLKKYKEERV